MVKATNAEARIAGAVAATEGDPADGVVDSVPVVVPALSSAGPVVQPPPVTAAKPRFTIAPRPQPKGVVVEEAKPDKRTVVERAKARAGSKASAGENGPLLPHRRRRAQCDDPRAVPRQMGTSEANIASPDAGSVGYISARDAERKMAGLMRSWCRRNNVPYVGTSARYVVVRIAQENFE